MFPKHQFSLKLPKRMPLLGMAPARRWVLATSFVDVSFQRNPTAFEVYRKLGGWAPDTVYVKVEWHGSMPQFGRLVSESTRTHFLGAGRN